MSNQIKLVDNFAKVNDNNTITNCQNVNLVNVLGQNRDQIWINTKFVFKTFEELKDAVQDLAWMPKT
jgi:hypothetical protein